MSSTSSSADLEEAVRRHAQVVEARELNDARRFACLADHAALLHGAGDIVASRRSMVSAAEHAQAIGDVFGAAVTWLHAAVIARQLGEGGDARDYVERARLLTRSPFLSQEQRAVIIARIRPKVR